MTSIFLGLAGVLALIGAVRAAWRFGRERGHNDMLALLIIAVRDAPVSIQDLPGYVAAHDQIAELLNHSVHESALDELRSERDRLTRIMSWKNYDA